MEDEKFLELPDLATDEDLAGFLHKSPATLLRERNKGTLPFRKVGGTVMYTRQDVKTYLDRCLRNAECVT